MHKNLPERQIRISPIRLNRNENDEGVAGQESRKPISKCKGERGEGMPLWYLSVKLPKI
jgi:hypothetical protein